MGFCERREGGLVWFCVASCLALFTIPVMIWRSARCKCRWDGEM